MTNRSFDVISLCYLQNKCPVNQRGIARYIEGCSSNEIINNIPFEFPPSVSRSMSRDNTGKKSWWRQYYSDHPAKGTDNSATASLGHSKWKVYCKKCFSAHIVDIQTKNEQSRRAGQALLYPPDQLAIEEYCAYLFLYLVSFYLWL